MIENPAVTKMSRLCSLIAQVVSIPWVLWPGKREGMMRPISLILPPPYGRRRNQNQGTYGDKPDRCACAQTIAFPSHIMVQATCGTTEDLVPNFPSHCIKRSTICLLQAACGPLEFAYQSRVSGRKGRTIPTGRKEWTISLSKKNEGPPCCLP